MNKEIKEICNKCELEINKQGKGCAFRSLGNEYCDSIENANNLINNLQNQVEKLTQENNDMEEEINSLNESITWWTNRFKAVERDNKNYKNVIDKAIKRLKGLQAINNGLGATIPPHALNDVIKILDGSLDKILRSKE